MSNKLSIDLLKELNLTRDRQAPYLRIQGVNVLSATWIEVWLSIWIILDLGWPMMRARHQVIDGLRLRRRTDHPF
jgi:hypothetical protein